MKQKKTHRIRPTDLGKRELSTPKRWIESLLKRFPSLYRYPLLWMGKDSLNRPPRTVRIENTNVCNAKCTYCPRDSMNREYGYMDFDLFKKIVDDCARIGVPNLDLHSYGEPLLDKKLGERIRYAKSRSNFHTMIITNGSLLTQERGRELIESGLDAITVSLDPGPAEMHDQVRLFLSHERIIRNLKEFLVLKKEMRSETPRVVLGSTLHTENEQYLEEFLEEWRSQVSHIHLQVLHNWGGDINAPSKPTFLPCSRLWLTLTVQCDGKVSLCCVDYSGKHILGDMRTSSIMEIWNNSEYRKIRHASLRGVIEDDLLCKTCTLPQKDSPLWIKEVIREGNGIYGNA